MMYWRKANHIHKWFVDNVQGGKDDCGNYYVSEEKLEELLHTCERILEDSKLVKGKVCTGERLINNSWKKMYEEGKVIENSETAKKLLPVTEGFFFGGTDYDEWYYKDIEDTVKVLKGALKMKHGGEFYYHSSW
jgi:hypothetical protein